MSALIKTGNDQLSFTFGAYAPASNSKVPVLSDFIDSGFSTTLTASLDSRRMGLASKTSYFTHLTTMFLWPRFSIVIPISPSHALDDASQEKEPTSPKTVTPVFSEGAVAWLHVQSAQFPATSSATICTALFVVSTICGNFE